MLNGKNMAKILIQHKATLVFLIGLILSAEIVHGGNLAQSVTIKPFHVFTNIFSNKDSPTEHSGAYSGGYTVWLWKSKDSLIGIFKLNEGEFGSGPEGTIEKVEFDPKSGNLSFESCLIADTINIHFEGSLKQNALEGDIYQTNEDLEPAYRLREKVILEKCCDGAPLFKEYVSIEEWKKDWIKQKPCQ